MLSFFCCFNHHNGNQWQLFTLAQSKFHLGSEFCKRRRVLFNRLFAWRSGPWWSSWRWAARPRPPAASRTTSWQSWTTEGGTTTGRTLTTGSTRTGMTSWQHNLFWGWGNFTLFLSSYTWYRTNTNSSLIHVKSLGHECLVILSNIPLEYWGCEWQKLLGMTSISITLI